MASDLVIQMEHISKSFNGVYVLKDVDFELRKEIHTIVGHNGAGKSTLMKILMGAYKADSGRILLNGEEVNFNSPRAAQRSNIAMVWQELANFPNLSITENMMIQRFEKGKAKEIDWAASRLQCVRYLERLNLSIDPDTKMRDLPLAQQQLVEFAKALSFDPKVLILDEPTSALSFTEQEILYEKVRLIKSQGVAIIFISHKLDEVLQLSDRISVFRDGMKIFTREAAELDKDQIIEAITGKSSSTVSLKGLAGNKGSEVKKGNKPAVEVRDLKLPRRLKGVSFEAYMGELLGVVGVSGSGISDVGRIIFGIEHDYAGEVLIDGKKAMFASPKDSVAAGLGYVPKDRKGAGIIPQRSVSENMVLSSLRKISNAGFVNRKKKNSTVNKLMDLIDLKPRNPDMPIGSLSGGNQQKGVIARWICKDSRILILDEPTRGVDVGAISMIYTLIRQLVQEGHCVILISSEFEEAHSVSDRMIVLKEGNVVAEVNPKDMQWEDVFTLAVK